MLLGYVFPSVSLFVGRKFQEPKNRFQMKSGGQIGPIDCILVIWAWDYCHLENLHFLATIMKLTEGDLIPNLKNMFAESKKECQ